MSPDALQRVQLETLTFVAATALGLVLLLSGLGKLRDPTGFINGILEYQVLPTRLAIAYGRMLPVLELCSGLALLAGLWPAGTGLVSAAMFLSFMLAVSINLARGRRIDCHCFGTRDGEPLGWITLARLAILLSWATLVALGRGGNLFVRPPADPLPALIVALGMVIDLYLLGVVPFAWRSWRTTVPRGVMASTHRVSLRDIPLVPVARGAGASNQKSDGSGRA